MTLLYDVVLMSLRNYLQFALNSSVFKPTSELHRLPLCKLHLFIVINFYPRCNHVVTFFNCFYRVCYFTEMTLQFPTKSSCQHYHFAYVKGCETYDIIISWSTVMSKKWRLDEQKRAFNIEWELAFNIEWGFSSFLWKTKLCFYCITCC